MLVFCSIQPDGHCQKAEAPKQRKVNLYRKPVRLDRAEKRQGALSPGATSSSKAHTQRVSVRLPNICTMFLRRAAPAIARRSFAQRPVARSFATTNARFDAKHEGNPAPGESSTHMKPFEGTAASMGREQCFERPADKFAHGRNYQRARPPTTRRQARHDPNRPRPVHRSRASRNPRKDAGH